MTCFGFFNIRCPRKDQFPTFIPSAATHGLVHGWLLIGHFYFQFLTISVSVFVSHISSSLSVTVVRMELLVFVVCSSCFFSMSAFPVFCRYVHFFWTMTVSVQRWHGVLKRVKRNPGREVSHIQIAQAHIQTQVVTSQGVYEVRVKVQHTRPISPKNLIVINTIINK